MLSLVSAAALASSWPPAHSRYDVVVLGTGLKESLLAGLLAQHGKLVLQLEESATLGGSEASFDLQQLVELTSGPDAPPLSEAKLGRPSDYSIERAPKMFIAAGEQLQMLVASGAWQHMNPPGFKRVHRALLYRKRPDGQHDVHRVLANSEDVLKTRMLKPLEKAKVVQFFLWVERYDESDARTHVTSLLGPLAKKPLDLRRMSALKFLNHWELPKEAAAMLVRGMALLEGPPSRLKKIKAIELVRRLKMYKEGYKTFPHMTTPYVYPVGGFGAILASATSQVLEDTGGSCCVDAPVDELLLDSEGACVGVQAKGMRIEADCVVASAAAAAQSVAPRYSVVRLYAVLAHPPNLCKDATSCQVIMPAEHCGRAHDVYLSSYSSTHGVAPKGKWVVVASTRIEGETEGLTPLAIAKRELAATLPLLKPTRKLLAEVTPYAEPLPEETPERLLVMSSSDETSYFDSVEAEVAEAFERITGEPPAASRASG